MAESRKVVRVVVIDPEDKCLQIRRSLQDARHPGSFELPGGGVDGDESVADAAVRELAEETGVSLNTTDLQQAYQNTSVEDDGVIMHRFLMIGHVGSRPEVALSDEHEVEEGISWLPPEELASNVRAIWGEAIRHAFALPYAEQEFTYDKSE